MLQRWYDFVEGQCRSASSVDDKEEPLWALLEMVTFQGWPIVMGDDAPTLSESCGGFLDFDNTKIRLFAGDGGGELTDEVPLVLEVGEESAVQALLVTHICDYHPDGGSTCGGEVVVDAEFEWEWQDGIDVTVTGDDTVVVTGVIPGTHVLTASAAWDIFYASADVEIGPQSGVDVLFLFNNHSTGDYWLGMGNYLLQGGLRSHLSEITAALSSGGTNVRAAVAVYDQFPVDPFMGLWHYLDPCPELGYTAELSEYQVLVPFVNTGEGAGIDTVTGAIADLELNCSASNLYGESTLTALKSAIDGVGIGDWRPGDDVSRMIFVMTTRPTCAEWQLYWGLGCGSLYPEPFTGYTYGTIIDAAVEKDIVIHAAPIAGNPDVRDWIENQLGYIAQATGGEFIDVNPVYWVHETIAEIIADALE